MLHTLAALRGKCAIGFVGGSNLVKQQEQIGDAAGVDVTTLFDFCFAENGLTAYRLGEELPSQSFIQHLGEEKYRRFVKFCLQWLLDNSVDVIPVVRGTFIEFRNGMVNISPVGRNASTKERNDFEAFDKIHNIRPKMVEALREEFKDYGLTFSIGGQISFDVFPTGWDKTYCLKHVEAEAQRPGGVKYETIHFFGDKTFKGGNDWEIAEDKRTTAHPVKNPEETIAILKKLFDV
jgi:phosphomannomutase